jgi:hypothetical protein
MAKKMKKINPKDTQKNEVMTVVREALANAGYEVLDGEDFAMTKGTVVIRAGVCDVQLKPITPKAGIDRYEVADEDTE